MTMDSPAQKPTARGALASLLEANTDKLLTCVHCGLCLPACPTYRQLGNENDSPRGRVYLMRGVVEGRIDIRDSFISHIDLCLGCRACEPVCPSGVPYGHLLEAARVEVSKAKLARGQNAEGVLRFVLNRVFTKPRLLGSVFTLARWFRDSGLARVMFKASLVRGRLRFALALLLASGATLRKAKSPADAKPSADASEAVAILRGCVMEGLFRETNRATERVLVRSGCKLITAKEQVCCGALHAHAGQLDTAKQLARQNIDAFLESGAERVIVNAAGCGVAMKEYGVLLADDPVFADRAREFSSLVRDVSEFLIERGSSKPTGQIDGRVAYDAPCHLIHAQRITHAPIELLSRIPGLTLVPLRGYETCCGGAGIYNLQHPELSDAILRDKISSIRESGAEMVATANPGCIMQIGAGILMNGLNVKVVHPIDLIDSAYED
ncbi:MAG TPA: heterodisulfide reductase-related iron-sulfur binding cluster [Blastocatellia bacterium]|nr:heterodisulfide reductase-related iron-sulfur binding cluster [Blastocatellia bacterium]